LSTRSSELTEQPLAGLVIGGGGRKMSMSYPRIPAHSIETEQSVIGGILLANCAYIKIAGANNRKFKELFND